MSIYEKHIFICTNEREAQNPVGCCSRKGGNDVLKCLKDLVKTNGYSAKVRVNKAGCLGQCAQGVTAVVYPEGIWYQNLDEAKAVQIFEQHIKNNKAVTELMFPVNKNP